MLASKSQKTVSNQPPQNKSIHHSLWLLFTLYLAQGLPAGFITQALQAILRSYHVSLVAIGWSGFILLPWALKFLWAPWVDTHYSHRWGRARGWIVPLQLLSVLLLVILALLDPVQLTDRMMLVVLYGLLFLLSFLGATHDVATDALATRLLKRPITSAHSETTTIYRQSQGNAIQVFGYRIGLIIGGGVLLMLLGKIGWRASFLAMALLVLLNTLPILRYQELTSVEINQTSKKTLATFTNINSAVSLSTNARPQSVTGRWLMTLRCYIRQHYAYFYANRELLAWVGVLISFKIADGLSSGMVKPMMVDLGIGLEQIGFWVTMLGSAASLVGASIATVLMKRLGHFQTLLGFNLLQAVITGLYGLVYYGYQTHNIQHFYWVYAVNMLEHAAASMALIALLTGIMRYARHDHAGSDFSIQVCLFTMFSGLAHFGGAYLAQWLGYTTHFLLSMLIGILCLLPIIYWQRCIK